MDMLNRSLADALDAQRMIDKLLQQTQPEEPSGRPVFERASGEGRRERRARERAERKAALRAMKAAAA
jgi:hypothetical protein